MRVFIVDDSAIVRERLATMFSELTDIELIGQAQHPLEATESIRKLKPDLVILDIRLRGGSGIDVLQEIKQGNAAPIVMILTNYPYPQYRKKCADAGAEHFFDKSAEFDKVPEVLQKLIENSQFGHRGKDITLLNSPRQQVGPSRTKAKQRIGTLRQRKRGWGL